MFKNILLAFDGSDHSRKAALVTGQLARQQQPPALVRITVAVQPIYRGWGEPNFTEVASKRAIEGQELLDSAAKLVGGQGGPEIEVHTELLFGPAADEIINVAEVRGCDLIVMGTRGLGALRGLLLGSQTQKVISHAHCPVMVIR